MLLRIVVNNFMSFGRETEFNMFPNSRYKKKDHHLFSSTSKDGDFKCLRMAAIYGANAAGKSNLIKAFRFLQDIVLLEEIPPDFDNMKFRLHNDCKDQPITIGIEFIANGIPCLYALQIDDAIIIKEELYESGLGTEEDKLIFERVSSKNKTEINFFNEFYEKEENVLLKGLIEKNLSKPFKPILKLLNGLENEYLKVVENAYVWFEDTLRIINPQTKPNHLAHLIDIHPEFHSYMKSTIQALHVGIKDIEIEKIPAREFFGSDDERIFNRMKKRLEEREENIIEINNKDGDVVCIVKEDNQLVVKRLRFIHEGDCENHSFLTTEESDGTKRLLELAPAFLGIINDSVVFVIDEIERSLHPLLVKKMLKIISDSKECKGQIIFTTHESNLLDQDIFRKDEIWFAEKNSKGLSDIYSLSDFKQHHTIDIRKGYLNGRYGAIPFLGNLSDLSWTDYDFTQK